MTIKQLTMLQILATFLLITTLLKPIYDYNSEALFRNKKACDSSSVNRDQTTELLPSINRNFVIKEKTFDVDGGD